MRTPDLPTGRGAVGPDSVAAGSLYVPRTSGLTMKKAGLRYAAASWFVLPVAAQSEDPSSLLGSTWHEQTSRDEKVIKGWFRQWPNAGLAVDLARSGAVAFMLDDGDSAPSDAVLDIMLNGAVLRAQKQPPHQCYVFAVDAGVSLRSGSYAALEGQARLLCEREVLVVEPSPRPNPEPRGMWSRYGKLDALSASLQGQLLEDKGLRQQPSETPTSNATPLLPTTTVSTKPLGRSHGRSEDAPRSTWAPVDIRGVLASPLEPLVASRMQRSDGPGLLYPGMVHSFFGEPESGKSLLMQWACAVALKQGDAALYIDFESDETSVMRRLVALGATEKQLRKRFTYVRPEADVSAPADARAWRTLLERSFGLAVIDGVTEALDLFGYQSNDNDNVARWMRTMPRVLAEKTGSAVALVDHVTKSRDGRGRFPVGAQAKLSAITGAAYAVEAKEALMQGGEAEFILRLVKDRPGAVRPHAARGGGRSPMIARAVITSPLPPNSGRGLTVNLEPPGEDTVSEQRPMTEAHLDHEILDAVSSKPGLTQTKLLEHLGGNRPAATARLRHLEQTKRLRTEPGSRKAKLYYPRDA